MKIDDAVRESLRRRAQAVKIDEDVWEAFAARQPLPAVEPSRRRRVATGVLAAVLAVVPFYALWLAFRPGPSTKPVGAPNSVIAFEFSENSPFLDGPGSGRPVLSIFTVSPDGSDAHRLSPDDGAEYGNVTWSPDGTRLAFDRFERDGDSSQEGIYVMRADGSDLHEIYRSALKPVSVRDIAWSPDGSQIAFVRTDYSESGSEAEDSLDVFVMNADGSNLRQVTRGTQFTSVGWTPDGKGFLVTIQRLADDGEHFTYDLGVVGLDGKIDRELTDDGVSMEPSWSPDGTRITFLRSRGENSRDSSRDVMVMSGEGGPATALTHLEPGAVAAWPTWAPDGSRVAYSVFDSFPKSCSIEVTDMSGMTTSVIGGVELGGCPERLSWQPAAATRPAESDGPEVITKPMGIPISLRYPSDWFAQSVSQTTVPDGTGDKQIGLVISNAFAAMPSADASAPNPGPLPEDPRLPRDFVTVTILSSDVGPVSRPDSPLPLSMGDAEVAPGAANVRYLEARVAGQPISISVQGGAKASSTDYALADAIVASIRPTAPPTDPSATYTLTDFRIVYPYLDRRHDDAPSEDRAKVSFATAWPESGLPGTGACDLRLRGTDGDVVGEQPFEVIAGTDGARSTIIVSVTGEPTAATASCVDRVSEATDDGSQQTIATPTRIESGVDANGEPIPVTEITFDIVRTYSGLSTCYVYVSRSDGTQDSPAKYNVSEGEQPLTFDVQGTPESIDYTFITCGPFDD